MLPLISCLCPTKNKPKIVKKTIEYFKNQTYPNKELILVVNEDSFYLDTVKKLVNGNVKLFYAPKNTTLGDIRNISVSMANGMYVAQWDDDNAHHKNRLWMQYLAIKKSNKKACFLKRVLVNDTISGDKGVSFENSGVESTMLALKSELPKYPSISVGEDVPIKKYFVDNNKHVILNEPQLYTYNIHSKNTCKYEHLQKMIDVII
tara:strand:+ start:91 stop:705 length:615 start_codon:yes stop_codon:yes gene_type:complete